MTAFRSSLLALVALCLASPASAACRVEYKAKQDSPLRLDFGVATLSGPACTSKSAASSELAQKLKSEGWTLLAIVSIVDGTRGGNDKDGNNNSSGKSKPEK
ncbi:MAG: hypothetical protein WA822_13810 [Albidovulum sp.]